MKIHNIRAFTDNFIFVVEQNGSALVVDPGDAEVTQLFLKEHKLSLHSILITHCHHDHIGGVNELLKLNSKTRVLGPSRVKDFGIDLDVELKEASSFEFQGSQWQCLHLPGHTLDHLAHFNLKDKILFCGDIIFSLGCGRLFEGSFEQAYLSMQRLKDLPMDTKIYCTHEYTLANCNFCIAENLALHAEYSIVKNQILEKLKKGQDTVPTNLEFELQYNPFLKATSVEEFAKLRLKRNDFKSKLENL